MKWLILFMICFVSICAYAVYYVLTHDINEPIEKPSFVENANQVKNVLLPEPITLERLFDDKLTDPIDNSYTILFTGDVMLGRKVNAQTIGNNNFSWAFENVGDELRNSDITVINLEGPIINNCPVITDGFKFCGDAKHTQGLVHAGVDIANLANNHSDNYGLDGLTQTKDLLSAVSIDTFNQDERLNYDYNGRTIAFLGYNTVFQESGPLIPIVQSDIEETKRGADVVIVSFHWGDEYTSNPNKHQTTLARASIDAGADLVVGHHPHWIQSIEIYNDKLILYSLGNFIFDQMWSEKTREGTAVKTTFYDNQLIDAQLMPVKIHDFGQPQFLEGVEKNRILDEIKQISY